MLYSLLSFQALSAFVPSVVPPHMVSTPNNTCVSLDFETISENDAVSLVELLPEAGDEEEVAVEAVGEIIDEFWNRSEDEHEKTLVAETVDERTSQGQTRKRISEVFLDQHQQSTTFSIPLRLVFVSGRGVPKVKDVKKIRQKTKKRRW